MGSAFWGAAAGQAGGEGCAPAARPQRRRARGCGRAGRGKKDEDTFSVSVPSPPRTQPAAPLPRRRRGLEAHTRQPAGRQAAWGARRGGGGQNGKAKATVGADCPAPALREAPLGRRPRPTPAHHGRAHLAEEAGPGRGKGARVSKGSLCPESPCPPGEPGRGPGHALLRVAVVVVCVAAGGRGSDGGTGLVESQGPRRPRPFRATHSRTWCRCCCTGRSAPPRCPGAARARAAAPPPGGGPGTPPPAAPRGQSCAAGTGRAGVEGW